MNDGAGQTDRADQPTPGHDPARAAADVLADIVSVGLDATLGVQFGDVTGDGSVAWFDAGPMHHQPFGVVHGGVYCSVVETLASISAAMWLHSRDLPPTVVGVNNSTDFLASVTAGRVTGRSSPIHRGRSQQLWQVDLTNEAGRLVAQGRVRLQNLDSRERR